MTIRLITVSAIFMIALASSASAPASACEAQTQVPACATVTDGVGAWVTWQGGELEVVERDGTSQNGGTGPQRWTERILSITLRVPETGQPYFECFTELPPGTFTLNDDGSATLEATSEDTDDPGCQATVTWTPASGYPRVAFGMDGEADPLDARPNAFATPRVRLVQDGVAEGIAAGETITDNEFHHATTYREIAGCAASIYCEYTL